MIYDVLVIGAGPSGLYASLIVQKATPVQNVSENYNVKVIESSAYPGGLTKFGFIQISKKWAFHGKNLIGSLFQEGMDAGVQFGFNETVQSIEKDTDLFWVKTDKNEYQAKFVIISTGIMTFPDVMLRPEKTNIGLHTPKEMAREFKENYGWSSVLVVGNHKNSVEDLCSELKCYFDEVSSYIIDENIFNNKSDYINGVPRPLYDQYDGIVYDYNSYKLKNGTTNFIKNLPLEFMNGYIITDKFGETCIKNLFAAGTVTTPTSGVMAAIYSAQIAAFSIGRRLGKTTKSDESGRFPFFPREDYWAESYQEKIKEMVHHKLL